MKKIRNKILFCVVILIVCLGVSVRADDIDQSNSFSISPLNPDTNQPQSSYYNLKVKPSEKKTIKVRIFNSGEDDIEVNVEANNASTNDNGVISYTNVSDKDPSLKIPFSNIATLKQKRVKVPKNSSTDVEIVIQMPKEKYEGIILGGIRVSGVPQEKESSKNKPAVKANIAYSVAVLLAEDDKKIDPRMGLLGVEKVNKNYRNYINAKLQNAAPRLIKELKVHARIYKKESTQLLYESQKSDMQMAPNSQFKFGVSLENTPIQPGEYVMEVTGEADGTPFSFKEDFKVTKEEAKSLNKNAIYVRETSTDNTWLYLIIGPLGFILVCIICYLLYRNKKIRKKGQDNEDK